MKMTIMKLMMLISTTISMLNTPMTMGVLLLIQTSLSTILIAKTMTSSWMPMIIFLMLIGGLLILFMYMSSIASNEKFKPNMYIILLMFIMILPVEEFHSEIQMNEKLINPIMSESITLIKIYNKKTLMITIMVFLYLLLAMISITSIIKIYKGPLRSK
uniref:NADH dehydrogenase subunit 6 n=1 Tax=Mimotettix multispinosus TaxID=2914181 RepID=UPI001EDD7A0A|nr:NADH dehydrogenase subunit 6 [Mimotettix multispinosus]UKE80375.1 NADH dehydrogenase subunit 6 [Mimotettix multispinosus]